MQSAFLAARRVSLWLVRICLAWRLQEQQYPALPLPFPLTRLVEVQELLQGTPK